MRRNRLLLVFAAVATVLIIISRAFVGPNIVNAPPPAGPIIAFGDSLTAGVGADEGQTYPDQLGRLINRQVINKGVSGETAQNALSRIEADVLNEKPSIVIVLLGGNDLLQRRGADLTFADLEQIVTRCQGAGAMVVLVGIEQPSILSSSYGKRFKVLARKTGSVYVPNILGDVMGTRSLMADQIHPNSQGYAIVAKRIADALEPYL